MRQPRILYRHGQPVSAQIVALHGTRTAANANQNHVWAGEGSLRPVPASPGAIHVGSGSADDVASSDLVPATPELVDITLAGTPDAGAPSVASVTDGVHTYSATYTAGTLGDLATALAAAINGNDGYSASAAGPVVSVSGPTGYTLTDASHDDVTASFVVTSAGTAEIPAVVGTGAHSVKVFYLNGDGQSKSESIALNGTSPVASVATDVYRIQSVVVESVGSAGAAVGSIYIIDAGESTMYETVLAGATASASVIYTVPASKSLYIDRLTATPGNSTVGHVRLIATALPEAAVDAGVNYVLTDFYASQLMNLAFHDAPLGPFPAGSQISVTVEGDGSLVAIDLLGYLDD